MCGWDYLVSFFLSFFLLGGVDANYFSVMSFVGYDYRKERKATVDDNDDSPLEDFDDENANNTTGSC